MNRTKVFFGIFLLTLSVLMLELSLTRLFSATMYYHFAFMAVSLALFGSGASGVFIYTIQNWLDKAKTGRWMSVFSILYALSLIFALYVIFENPLVPGGSENYSRLVKIYAATSLPFFFAGCAVTLAITRYASDISRLYLFDLAGAALGCLLLIPFLNTFGAINVLIGVGGIGALAAILFSLADKRNSAFTGSAALLALGLVGFAVYNNSTHTLDIRKSKGRDEQKIHFAKWNSFSRITVQGDMEKELNIVIDADAATTIVPDGGNIERHRDKLSKDVSAIAYHLKPNANVAIIGPGGGLDVTTALIFDAKKITAVEINPIIARDVMLNEPFKTYNGGIYQHPKVQLEVDEGRSFIRRSSDRYDVLQATMVDTWAATAAGAFSLTENNLYTVEAFKEYATHLTDDGIFTMTRWYFEPPDQLLRLISLTRVMMDELNISNPERHLILVRDVSTNLERTPATFIFKKSEFTDEEVRQVELIAARNNFQLLYTPLTQPANIFTQMIKAQDPATVWNAFETNVNPTYDNNPFFFNSLRLSNMLGTLKGSDEWRKTNLGTKILFALFGITTVLVILFIILPLIFVRNRAVTGNLEGRMSYLFYFACLGAGFIIVEMAMIQKFILFLGHPVYALAVILFSLLTFSALGSYLTGRINQENLRKTLVKLIFVLVGVTFLYILLLPTIFYGLVWLPLVARIIISILLMAPLALLMGMPMPIGIKLLRKQMPQIIPWAWGVNGAASVMGSVAALVIALLTGFNQALIIGAAIYLLSALLITRPKEVEETAIIGEESLREMV
jgi:predicted membrane-bound spermidine synthase